MDLMLETLAQNDRRRQTKAHLRRSP